MAYEESSTTENTWRAWLASGASSGLFCTVGFLNSFGIFQEYYATNQLAESPQSTIAWLGATSIFFLFSISVVSGSMLDTLGPKLPLYLGSIGTVLSVMMTSLCKEFYQFLLAQGALLGLYVITMGIVLAGSSLGGVIWPIAIDKLLKRPRIGFPWTMRIVGFIMIPCLAFSCITARSPEVPSESVENANRSRKSTSSNVVKEEKDAKRKTEVIALLHKPEMQLLCLAMFITYFGMFSPFFYTTSYAAEKGFPSSFGFYTVSTVNGASFFGHILPGIVADKYGKFNSCIISTLMAGIVALCWTRVESRAGLGVWAAAYGFASGGILSLQQACAAQVATRSTLGLAIGTVTGSTALSAMANVPIGGALVEKYGYMSLSIFSGVALLLGGMLLSAARFAQTKKLTAVV